MTLLELIGALCEHAFWADARLLEALEAGGEAAPEALREHAHVLGAEETWLARIEGRAPSAAVWPEASLGEVRALAERTEAAYRRWLGTLTEEGLRSRVTYTNSAGQEFTSSVGDILLQVALHGQYHRGKVNLLLRQAGRAPAPVDYIAWVRGAAAATAGDPRRARAATEGDPRGGRG